MDKTLFLAIQHCSPHRLLSWISDRVAHCPWRWLRLPVIRWFIRRYGVNMDEAFETNLENYPHFNAFFTRQLKPGVRTIESGPTSITSPVDGTLYQAGEIKEGLILQAKNHHYTLQDLLGGSATLAEQFTMGQYATIYLSPPDYHHVHMPYDGRLVEMIYVPGRLFSVNPITTANIPNLFARNERVICCFETEQEPLAVILVGAMLVGSIAMEWLGKIDVKGPRSISHWDYRDQNRQFKQGDVIGHFQMGSTVIILGNQIKWDDAFVADTPCLLGKSIGQVRNT